MNLATVTLWLAVLMFGVFGAWLLVEPDRLDDWLQIEAGSPAARTELRALYGGLEIGFAAFLTICALHRSRHALGCLAVGCVMIGVGGARIYGMVVDGDTGGSMLGFLVTELLFGLLGVVGFVRSARVEVSATDSP